MDYVRAMAFSKDPGRLFSISDDGQLMIHDLHEQALVAEFNTLKNKHPIFDSSYTPIYKGMNLSRSQGGFSGPFIREHRDLTIKSESCPTCIAATDSGNFILVGYSDDSIILKDVRS